jgi:hypothetical protein
VNVSGTGTGPTAGGGGPAAGGGGPTPSGAPVSFDGTQGCLGPPAESGHGTIAWDRLRNPILSYDSRGVRDIALRLLHGQWHLLFTSVVGSAPDWGITSATTSDLATWDPPVDWPPQPGTTGLASPDVTRSPDGTYVVTYQSDPGETDPPGPAKLYYRTSPDLVHWSAPHRLAPTIHPAPADRLIDAALAWTPHGLALGYKFGSDQQHFEIAWSASGSLDGPWQLVGRPDITVYGDTIENYEFLPIDGVWNLLATSNMFDRPWLFTLTGDATRPDGWLHWSAGRELEVPLESWNSGAGLPGVNYEIANSAYLCDLRRVDGYFYLLYIGTNELKSYGGWGHTKLGIARSRDLVVWQVPGGAGGAG